MSRASSGLRAFVTERIEEYIPFTATANLNIGGLNAGTAGDGGEAVATVAGQVQTMGDWASGVVVQSIGGGGGSAGSADATNSLATMNLTLNLGGYNSAGSGGAASANLEGAKIVTGASDGSSGFSASGVIVQSIGGGGGSAADGSDSAQGNISIGSGLSSVLADLFGQHGTVSGAGGPVALTGNGDIVTYGVGAHGVVLQSIGAAEESEVPAAARLREERRGRRGRSGRQWSRFSRECGTVTATGLNLGIHTYGDNAFGLLAQSIGGGGGLGAVVEPSSGAIQANSEQTNEGGAVQIGLISGSSITTQGLNSYGIFAQSIGGGGGIAGYSNHSNFTLDSQGSGTADGSGGAVSVTLAQGASISTTGEGAHGIVAQSVGNGGGLQYLGGLLTFGSSTSGGVGVGGPISIDVEGSVAVSGTGAFAIMAQSTNATNEGGNINITIGGTVTSSHIALYLVDGNQNTLTVNAGGMLKAETAIDNTSQQILQVYNYGMISGSAVGGFTEPIVALGGATSPRPIQFNNYGTFLAGNLVEADVMNAGTMGIGTQRFARTELTGNLTQTSEGQLVFNTDFVGRQADFLTIDGDANLAGKLKPVLTNLLSNVPLPVMQINGALTGDLTVQSSPLFNFALVSTVSQRYDIVATTSNFDSLAASLTPNQKAIARHFASLWETSSNPLLGDLFADFDSVLVANPNGLANLLDQFNPVNFASFSSSTAFNNTSFVTQQFDSYLANHRGADGTFVSSAGGIDYSNLTVNDPDYLPGLQGTHSRLLAWNPAPSTGLLSDSESPLISGVNMQDSKMVVRPEPTDLWNFFIAGDAILARGYADSSVGTSNQNDTTGAMQLGVDYRVTPHFLVGATFGFAHTQGNFDSQGSSATIDTYAPGVYASYADGGWYANGLASYGFNSYQQQRNVAIGALAGTASSSPNGNQIVGNLDGGYDFHRGPWTFGPTLGLQYVHLTVDGYSETGVPGANLDVNENQSDSLRSRLGARVNYAAQAGGVTFIPHASASWQHEFMDQSRGVTSQLDGIGGGFFSVQTAAPSRESVIADVGLDAQLDQTWTVFADYSVQAGQSNYFGQSVQAGVKIGF